MGLFDRFRASAALPELPTPPRVFANTEGAGYYVLQTVTYDSPEALTQFEQVPNASRDDLIAFIESVNAVSRLAEELLELDAELVRASNGELKGLLRESWVWKQKTRSVLGSYRATSFQYDPEPYWAQHAAESALAARQWVDANLPEPQHSEFVRLLERRAELRTAAMAGFTGFEATCAEIRESYRKAQVIAASQAVDPEAGADARPALELESVDKARGLAGAVSAGLNEAYRAATKPALEPFATPARALESHESTPDSPTL